MRVVKLGGSLAAWSELPACLASLVARPCIIVPGGGPFADQVRDSQRRWRFDDATAHDMAILAMAQFGRMLAGLNRALRIARTMTALQARVADGLATVWVPDPDDADLRAVPPSWDITSDSLAAWLSCRVRATELILLKSAPVPSEEGDLERFAKSGIVDPAFAQFTARASYTIWICERDAYRGLHGVLGESPGLVPIRMARPAPALSR